MVPSFSRARQTKISPVFSHMIRNAAQGHTFDSPDWRRSVRATLFGSVGRPLHLESTASAVSDGRQVLTDAGAPPVGTEFSEESSSSSSCVVVAVGEREETLWTVRAFPPLDIRVVPRRSVRLARSPRSASAVTGRSCVTPTVNPVCRGA